MILSIFIVACVRLFHFISFHLIIFIQGKYSSHKNVDLQTALSQKKSYKVTVKIGTIRYVKVKGR